MVENTKIISDSLEDLLQNDLNFLENNEINRFSLTQSETFPLKTNPIIDYSDSNRLLEIPEPEFEKDDQDTEKIHQKTDESSSGSTFSNRNPEVTINEKSFPIFKYKKKSRMDYSITPFRANLFKDTTLGLTPSSRGVTYKSVKSRIKDHLEFTLNLLRRFQQLDKQQYSEMIKKKAYSNHVKNVFNQFFLLNKNFFDHFLVFFLNSYEEEGLCRLFESFFLSFDLNSDKKMQMKEMIKCFECLSQEQHVGKKKMKETFKEIEVYVKDPMNCFQEKSTHSRYFSEMTYINLFNKFKFVLPHKKKLLDESQFIDFFKLSPLMIVFFLEYKNKLFLSKKEASENIMGVPRKLSMRGKLVFDPSGDAKGLFRVFVKLLNGEADIKKPLISYRIVCQAVIEYRTTNFPQALTTDSIERILKDLKIFMDVDPVSLESRRKFSLKELLPTLSGKISSEIKWNSTTYNKSIEKYDELVNSMGGSVCYQVNKKVIHKMMSEAFKFLHFPFFDQFVKGLDYVLHRAIPTLVTPAAVFIATGLIKTPDCAIIDEEGSENRNIRFNLPFILQNDNLFERLLHFTTNTKLTLLFARILYKDHYSSVKKHKKINRQIFVYNQIIKNTSLFDELTPGLYGQFDDVSLALIKSRDPKQIKKDEKLRKELKMKRFLEYIIHRDNKRKEKIIAKRFALKTLHTFTEREGKSPNLARISKLFSLQLEATSIDQKIDSKEREKKAFEKTLRESSAYPNTKDITPDIIFNCIQNSSHNSSDVEELARFIYMERERINFQDIHKFIINQHLVKTSGEKGELISGPSVYQVPEVNLLSQGDGEESDENSFEEKYFTEVANRRSMYLKVDIPEEKRRKLRGCCCTII